MHLICVYVCEWVDESHIILFRRMHVVVVLVRQYSNGRFLKLWLMLLFIYKNDVGHKTNAIRLYSLSVHINRRDREKCLTERKRERKNAQNDCEALAFISFYHEGAEDAAFSSSFVVCKKSRLYWLKDGCLVVCLYGLSMWAVQFNYWTNICVVVCECYDICVYFSSQTDCVSLSRERERKRKKKSFCQYIDDLWEHKDRLVCSKHSISVLLWAQSYSVCKQFSLSVHYIGWCVECC